MFKKYLSIFSRVLSALVILLQFFSPIVYAFSGSGNGISGDPYIITSCSQLQEMNDSLNSYYELGNNINCSATSTWNSGDGFEPIGNVSQSFSGNFNGAGRVISNLFINRPGLTGVGLFGMTDGATISSVGLENLSIVGDAAVGGVVGDANSATDISNVYTTGTLSANNLGGGVIGGLFHSTAEDSYSTADITVNSGFGGGFGGTGNVGIAKNSFATGTVNGTGDLGGLFGSFIGTVTNSYSVLSTLIGNTAGTTIDGGSSGGVAIVNFYQATPLHAVYISSPSWDFNTLWGFVNNNSLPIFRDNIHPASVSQSGGDGFSSPPSCTSLAPTNAPDLFQMTDFGSSVTLYFAPVSGQNSGYTISYGTTPSADQYATSFSLDKSTGVVPYAINYLYPGTWYFKVRGQNGCMPGSWSPTRQINVSLFGKTTIVSASNNVLGTSAILTNSACVPNYVIKSGDSLWSISSKELGSGTKYVSIMQKNNLKSSMVHAGQTLKLNCS